MHRTESPPSLASCFRLRYSSRETWETDAAVSLGNKETSYPAGPRWCIPDPSDAVPEALTNYANTRGLAAEACRTWAVELVAQCPTENK